MTANPPRLRRRPVTTTEPDILDGDDEQEPETGPLRRCIVTRARLPKECMFRFVVGPDRILVPDLTAKLPGRGIWLSASGDVLETRNAKADKQRNLSRAFARAARGPVSVPSDLSEVLEAALLRRIGEILGLARRAGQAVSGYEKAREWMRAGQSRLILQASDGSEAERQRFLSGHGSSVTVMAPLPGEVMGRIFGRDFAVHVAVKPGRLADSLAIESGRLAGLRCQTQETSGQDSANSNVEAGANG